MGTTSLRRRLLALVGCAALAALFFVLLAQAPDSAPSPEARPSVAEDKRTSAANLKGRSTSYRPDAALEEGAGPEPEGEESASVASEKEEFLVVGRVVDERGDPVPDVPVATWTARVRSHGEELARVRTDEEGAFRVRATTQARWVHALPGPEWWVYSLGREVRKERLHVEFVIQATAAIRGVVVRPDGEPVGHARVVAGWLTPRSGTRYYTTDTSTTRKGEFSLRVPREGRDLWVWSKARASGRQGCTWGGVAAQRIPALPAWNVVLAIHGGGVELSGWIVDAAGAPVTDVHVELVPIHGPRFGRFSAHLDDSTGAFCFHGLAPGRYLLSVGSYQDGVGAVEDVPVDAPATGLRIVCPAARVLRGRIVGPYSRHTLVELRVPGEWGVSSTGVCGNGLFDLDIRSPKARLLLIRDPESGRFAYFRDLAPIARPLEVHLHPGGSIGGTVRPKTDPRRQSRRSVVLTDGELVLWTRVNDRGRFILRGIPRGTYTLHWSDDRGHGELDHPAVEVGATDLLLDWPVD